MTTVMMMDAADFYTGIVAESYALLKSEDFPAERYADFIAASGEPALELGCGDGDPLLELRRRGFDVEGVDASADLLARCAARAEAAGLEVVTHQQRFEELDLSRSYRSIFLAGPTLNLLPNDDLALLALRRVREHLADDGSVLVPLWVPAPAGPEEFGAVREATADDGSRLTFVALSEDYDAQRRTRTTAVRYGRHTAEGEELTDRDWVIHWHTQESFAGLAREAGLQVADLTDLHGSPVTGDEEQFTFTLTR